MADVKREIYVLFGSQTGTAEDVAERISRDLTRRHILPTVLPLDDYALERLVNEDLAVFVVSTTGQGDPPDNMKKFWRFLMRKNLPEDCLAGVNFVVLGLGDSAYLKFNFVAKKLHKRLLQLGASPLLPPAFANEQHELGLENVIGPWLEKFLASVLEVFPLKKGQEIIAIGHLLPPKYRVRILESTSQCETTVNGKFNGVCDKYHPLTTVVVENIRKTHENHFQDVRLLSFNIQHTQFSYKPGDVLMVQPCNYVEVVKELFTLLPWDPATIIETQLGVSTKIPMNLPSPLTLWDLFSKHLTIQAPPKRYFFELLAHFTTSEMERERLMEFCSKEGQEDLYEYCYRPKRNYLEVLQDFPVVCKELRLEYLFDLFPLMQARAFSIATSFKEQPTTVGILMAVVSYKTKMQKRRKGVCSTWLASLHYNHHDNVNIWVVPGTIGFPKDPATPVIMIGPGTGVAPFRSFIRQRIQENATGEMLLFFGCRNARGDDFFRDEWEMLSARNSALKVFTAYSRDQEQKVYVQHRMIQEKHLVWELISEKDAYVYIAGNSKDMPNDVIAVLKRVFTEEGRLSEIEADRYFTGMQTRRRFQCETWS